METARPFSSPAWVSLAGLTLIGLAAASFAAGLWRQLDQPRPDNSAKVVVISSQAPSLAAASLPMARPTVPPAVQAPASPRRVRAAREETPAPPEPALAADLDVAVDAAATGPVAMPLEPPPEPAAEPAAPPY